MLAFQVTKRRFEAQQMGILQKHERLPDAKYQELLKQGTKPSKTIMNCQWQWLGIEIVLIAYQETTNARSDGRDSANPWANQGRNDIEWQWHDTDDDMLVMIIFINGWQFGLLMIFPN